MKRNTCPACGHRFSLLTEPKFSVKRKDVRAYTCTACGAELKLVGSLAKQLQMFGLFAAATVLITGTKWIAYHIFAEPYATIAWAVSCIFVFTGTILAVATLFEYETQPDVIDQTKSL